MGEKPQIIDDVRAHRQTDSLTPEEAYWAIKTRVCFGYKIHKVSELSYTPEPGSLLFFPTFPNSKKDRALPTEFFLNRTPASAEELLDLDLSPDGIR